MLGDLADRDALSNTTAAIRKSSGAQETDKNSTDFAVGAPAPRATADYSITVVSTTPAGANVPLNTNIGITLNEPATPGDGTFGTLADLIVHRLLSPDVISLEEIQDNDGETNSTTVDASVTGSTTANSVVNVDGEP